LLFEERGPKICFVLFSRAFDKNAKKLAHQFKGKYDFFVLTYDDKGESKSETSENVTHIVYNRKSLETVFGNSVPKFAKENWSIMPGNLDLCHLLFVVQHNSYNYYWFCEDDVRYTGDMTVFIDKFIHNNDALLVTNYRGYGPEWWPQNSYISPIKDSKSDKSVFLPFFRISNVAAKTLINAYAEGWSGHHEISWPSVLRYNKMTITDINSIVNCYTSSPEVMGMGPGTFIYMPPKLFTGFEKNKLYHPVKPFKEYKKRTWFRIKKDIKRAIGRN